MDWGYLWFAKSGFLYKPMHENEVILLFGLLIHYFKDDFVINSYSTLFLIVLRAKIYLSKGIKQSIFIARENVRGYAKE
ncbi:MAG: hypothetical protein B9J98_02725 [Candidatus Terraquivivens tikiterensis]|uniref:Uncharacterized protein n=1 Tax=Candidatus Terraquivivens tikiterensis TaxID=1980982 RepID=A0A2R7Y6R8_9ARCH|nr:MAG: hypothetical protein B9J98_02725 [Candidatus Terraquivivens tikiterensis]